MDPARTFGSRESFWNPDALVYFTWVQQVSTKGSAVSCGQRTARGAMVSQEQVGTRCEWGGDSSSNEAAGWLLLSEVKKVSLTDLVSHSEVNLNLCFPIPGLSWMVSPGSRAYGLHKFRDTQLRDLRVGSKPG